MESNELRVTGHQQESVLDVCPISLLNHQWYIDHIVGVGSIIVEYRSRKQYCSASLLEC